MLFKRITSHLNEIEWKGQQLYYNIAFDKRTAALSFCIIDPTDRCNSSCKATKVVVNCALSHFIYSNFGGFS